MMGEQQYLYGASVQGIQSFIFETNKLREIVGASELVEHICTDLFEEVMGDEQAGQVIQAAAGNVKCLFTSREVCAHVARNFPRRVMRVAPGVTISQAVVPVGPKGINQAARQELELRLAAQRNAPPVGHDLGWMVTERARQTGGAGVAWEEGAVIDVAQRAKRQAADNNRLTKKLLHTQDEYRFPSDISEIAGEGDWVAVVHADGNDLGKKIMRMGERQAPPEAFRELSERLEKATRAAAQQAFAEQILPHAHGGKYPFRPIVLGGDDLTAIVRGDLALPFANAFLKAFEDETKNAFKGFGYGFDAGLTACAGIAYIKPKYPFHYGVGLAEGLCTEAKKTAKGFGEARTPSCLLFHKMYASYYDNYEALIRKELKFDGIRLDYGPYFLSKRDGYATIEQLTSWVKIMREEAAPRSVLRDWLGVLRTNPGAAAQRFERICRLTSSRYLKKLSLTGNGTAERGDSARTHLHDVLAIAGLKSDPS